MTIRLNTDDQSQHSPAIEIAFSLDSALGFLNEPRASARQLADRLIQALVAEEFLSELEAATFRYELTSDFPVK